ncbi:Uncharacterized conserved protein, contains BSD domain [Phaffia rhodozyma]|uniref:Uncharacterized conserved protein, contains BSD domain n=1 Tax=Phaffia rhodozyma TaxID=264483 RepID=A0A0F7SFT3_PHARH|nr:Uncharacterized conserved protein, contains BSD domain [Phaffia rhodozyma]
MDSSAPDLSTGSNSTSISDPTLVTTATGIDSVSDDASAAVESSTPAGSSPSLKGAEDDSARSTKETDQFLNEPRKKESFKEGLENEVGQVMGSWKSFWGGVQKQVAPTISAVRKDLNSAATQARAEMERLQSEARARNDTAVGPDPNADFVSSAMMGDIGMGFGGLGISEAAAGSTKPDVKGKGRELPDNSIASSVDAVGHQANVAFQSLFAKLQSSLPTTTETNPDGTTVTHTSLPSLASFQQSLSHTLSSNPNLKLNQLDLPALRQNLTNSFQKLQSDLHLADAEKLAEDYLKKSENLLQDAGKFFQEAVKIVPPTNDGQAGVSWDGSDMWTIATYDGGHTPVYSQTDDQVSKLTGKSIADVRARRQEALLKALRSNKDLLQIDPAGSEETGKDIREAWLAWLKDEVEVKGGIEGDYWTELIWRELGPTKKEGVEELKATRDALVPSVMDKEAFWTRYFFRVHQIEVEAERRKTVLETAVTPAEDEAFSWDDEEVTTGTAPTTISTGSDTTLVPAPELTNSSTPGPSTPSIITQASVPETVEQRKEEATPSTTNTSPRISEESYDIVSQPSGNVRAPTSPASTAAERKEDDSEDSDWE